MISLKKVTYLIQAARPNQWIKNLVMYTSLVFSGNLLNQELFIQVTIGVVLFSMLSSTSYILNDIIDLPYDKKHPSKSLRPIATGKLSVQDATTAVFLGAFIALLGSLLVSVPLFLISLAFLALHFLYSLVLKHRAVIDIFAISFSFMLRAFAGEVLSGYHIQIWLLLSIFFISLFLATVKRHAELVIQGTKTRQSLINYNEHFLYFLTTTFATMTITTYSLYTFLERPPAIKTLFSDRVVTFFPGFEALKWFMITIPVVVYGIARYAQLLYERDAGETPEKIITKDKPLIISILLWGATVVSLIYIF
ncbi:MAG: Decaprenyl-phosphate phosphoribosyltransferase [Microgenomates bacterium OLB22]|nr:MAG: Decaprenyl-phosphate phosphoribosyltransferase [Microgenomates bacterium OLB22]